jgi:hypothetical protein
MSAVDQQRLLHCNNTESEYYYIESKKRVDFIEQRGKLRKTKDLGRDQDMPNCASR